MKISTVLRKLRTAPRLQELRSQTPQKNLLGLSLGEDVGFRYFSTIFNDTYRMIKHIISFWAINVDKKCKRLSNFYSVTLREFLGTVSNTTNMKLLTGSINKVM